MSDIVALFLLLFFVLWIVLTAVVVFYGFFRLIKCVLLVFPRSSSLPCCSGV